MKRLALPLLASALVVALGTTLALSVSAKPIDYKLPEETSAFKPGPGVELIQGNCGSCHSADYLETQPRGPKFQKDFWQAEVVKMIKVFGAPIEEADVPKIVDYLTANY